MWNWLRRMLASLEVPVWAWLLGIVLTGLGFVTLYMLIAMWPAVVHATVTTASAGTGSTGATGASGSAAAAAAATSPTDVSWFGWTVSLTTDVALLVLVVLAAALGAFVHGATSFATYAGNRELRPSWIWWYLLRVLIGSALALVFYFAFRGGFLSATSDSGSINPYGVAALSGLVGLFSKQATDKLEEVFETAFQTKKGAGDDARKDGLSPTPSVTGPAAIKIGQTAVTLTGTGFVDTPKAQVAVGGAAAVNRSVKFNSATELEVTLDTTDVQGPATLTITIVNPDGKTSADFTIQVQ